MARWPPIPANRLLARRTIATAFQRISRRIRRSSCLVAREVRLLLRADRVDVAGLGERRQADLELAGALEQLVDDEPGPALALSGHHLVERGEPILGLGGIDVGKLVLEFVEVHGAHSVAHLGRESDIAGW